MPSEFFGDFSPGSLNRDEAARLTALARAVERLARLSVSPPLEKNEFAGNDVLSVNLLSPEDTVTQGTITALITGGTNPYAWSEIHETAPGVWAFLAGGRSYVSDGVAYERNGDFNVQPGTRVLLYRSPEDPPEHWLFDRWTLTVRDTLGHAVHGARILTATSPNLVVRPGALLGEVILDDVEATVIHDPGPPPDPPHGDPPPNGYKVYSCFDLSEWVWICGQWVHFCNCNYYPYYYTGYTGTGTGDPGGGTLACCARSLGTVLNADILGCTCIPNDSYLLYWTPDGSSAAGCLYTTPGWYSEVFTCAGGKKMMLYLVANASACTLHYCCDGRDFSQMLTDMSPPQSCDPLDLFYLFSSGPENDLCCGGNFTVEVTEL